MTPKQQEDLNMAASLGKDTLIAFHLFEQNKRDHTAVDTYREYKLWKHAGAKFAQGVVTPPRKVKGEVVQFTYMPIGAEAGNAEAHKRWDCPDQIFCDACNRAFREAGLICRLEAKHGLIQWLLERDAFQGVDVWYKEGGE